MKYAFIISFFFMYHLNGFSNTYENSVSIDEASSIGKGCTIKPGTHIIGNSTIGDNCSIGYSSIIVNSIISPNCTIHPFSIIENSTIKANAQIGPFAHISENTVIEEDAIIGNFVDVKRSTVGPKSKAKHLAYIGDTTTGQNVNIGGGTITCNYNGVEKQHTHIEDNAFIGSNNSLVAPVTIGESSMTAAGSTITEDVPSDTLAIARTRQTNKFGYVKKLLARYREKKQNKNKE